MKTVGIIPSRFSSSRLPGKPLALIAGKPMIQRVYEQCLKSNLSEVIVATDDERILNTVLNFGGKAMLTSPKHKNGTERIAEIAQNISADYIVNIQGDEPFIEPEQINLLLATLTEPSTQIVTLAKFLDDESLFETPSIVKVVLNLKNEALYFSRSAIPFHQSEDNFGFYKHIGLYGFKKETILELVKLPTTNLEEIESLEQLRWLQNGHKIKVAITQNETISIDTPDDLAKAERFAKAHNLL
ncbi:MAG TPA: 3-deoxy-manno-octulosonate cytidylyltransferase [Chitinophagales bacterium]|nr:MAG: 3-deoxy-manno-octulosonate cytidylyltransferase [Bacteroidetes bacterium 37-13]HRN95038.1 3-deoxy-manno-octulosonate cytidylyltransferase [Chitinophagales bacterium]HRP38232.1 3-deoxy-manno-octulosonate cytidylyltransferase [Chitinophagales bacterium]